MRRYYIPVIEMGIIIDSIQVTFASNKQTHAFSRHLRLTQIIACMALTINIAFKVT